MLDRNIPPVLYDTPNLKFPDISSKTFPNGLQFGYINGGSQEVIQLSLDWTGGQSEAPVPAVARIMAALMMEGTSTMSGFQISETIDFHGAMMRFSASSHTTSLVVSVLNSMAADVLPIVRSVICDPAFDPHAFEVYRDMEVKNFLISQSKVSVLANQALMPMIKGADHPEARCESESEIASVTRDDVVDFYHKVFTASTCRAYLGGCYSDDVFALVEDLLSSLPVTGPGLERHLAPYSPQTPRIEVVTKPDAVQAAISMGIPAPLRSDPDYIPLRLATMALGGYFGSRLMKNIREDKGLTYGINAFLLGAHEGSYIDIVAQTDKEYVDRVVEEVKHEMVKLATEPMPQEELTCMLQHVSSSLLETLDSPFSIIDYYRTIDSAGIPMGYFDAQVEWLHKLDSSVIMKMAAKYMLSDRLRVAECV